MRNILIVDDQPDVRESLRLLLKGGAYSSGMAESPEKAIEAAAAGAHDLVLMDMNYARDTTSGFEGLALLEALRARHPDIPVVVMTAWSTIDLAVEAMRRGATDFITKPWENERVLETLARHAGAKRRDLSLAGNVQRTLLPPRRTRCETFESECVFLPAEDVGGDICDIFDSSFLLGDVAGKGMPAALLMANLHAAVRGNRNLATEPALLMERVNRLFFESTEPEYYATMFFGVCTPGSLRYVNCGHPAALLVRATGDVQELGATSTVLGAFEHATFETRTILVNPNDRLIVFSDGVSEARPEAEDWIADWVKMLVKAGLREVATSLAMAVANDRTDDVTVLDIRFV